MLVGELIERTLALKQALKDAGVSAGDVSEVVLVGGMTRMPKKYRKLSKSSLARNPQKELTQMKWLHWCPIQGGVLQGDVKDVLLLDVTPIITRY